MNEDPYWDIIEEHMDSIFMMYWTCHTSRIRSDLNLQAELHTS